MRERDSQSNMLISQDMFKALVSNIEEFAIFVVDANATILSWNAGAQQITGFTAAEVVGKSVTDLALPPPSIISPHKTATEVPRSNTTVTNKTALCSHRDGSQFTAILIIKPLENQFEKQLYSYQLIALANNLQKSDSGNPFLSAQSWESEFRNLANLSPNMIWSADLRGHCQFVNQRWTEYTGKTLEQTLGRGWLNDLHDEDSQRAQAQWSASIASGNAFDMEIRIRHNEGGFRWFKSRAMRIDDNHGQMTGWVGACTDIDEQKKVADNLEAAITERTSELAQLNKDLQLARDRALEASALKSRFVANISHEIRTPMSGVLGMAELLLTCELEDDAKELAQYIYSSARSLLDVVNDLLDFSKLEAGKLSIARMRFALPAVIDEAKQSTIVTATQKGLRLDLAVQPQLPEVYGDPVRIRQVLLNLLHNAIKFTSSGDIKLTVEESARAKNSITVKFTVEDTGIGISEDASKHLFNPFEQADGSTTRRYGGTGLGLSISKNLVKLMLGEIGFDSVEGKGSKFWFSIPLEIA